MTLVPLLPRRRVCLKRAVSTAYAFEIDRADLFPVTCLHLIDHHVRHSVRWAAKLSRRGKHLTNLKSVKATYEAFATGDIFTVIGTLSPDIAWTEAEGFPYGGTYHGPKAVLEGVFMRLGSEWKGFAAVPDEFIDA